MSINGQDKERGGYQMNAQRHASKGSEEKRGFRIASVRILSLVAVGAMLASAFPMFMPSVDEVTLPARAMEVGDEGNHTYETYTGEFASTVTRTWVGEADWESEFITDWGKVQFWGGEQWKFIDGLSGDLLYGTEKVRMRWYNEWDYIELMDGYAVESRPFTGHYSKPYTIINNDDFGMAERYAESGLFGETDWWNVTERITVSKHEPYIKVDKWLKDLRVQGSNVSEFSLGLFHAENPTTGTTYDHKNDRQLIVWDNETGYAVGMVGLRFYQGLGNIGTPMHPFSNYSYITLREDPAAYMHATAWIIVGDDPDDVVDKAERIGSCWNKWQEWDALNLLVVNNTERYDAFEFTNSTTYSYIPSAEHVTINANGIETTREFLPNPILNYQRPPVIITLDHHPINVDGWRWMAIMNLTEKYEVRVSLGISTNQTDLEQVPPQYNETDEWLLYFYDESLRYGSTGFEVNDHFWNHTGIPTWHTPEYAESVHLLSQGRWVELTGGKDLLTGTLPGNAWGGDHTFEGLNRSGLKMLRASVYLTDCMAVRQYGDLVILPWQYGSTGAMAGTSYSEIANRTRALGYTMVQGHQEDYGNEVTCGGASYSIHNLFSWLQNSTDVMSMTMAQFYDIYKANLVYNEDELDLTDCITDHMVYTDSYMGEHIYWDTASDELPSYPVYRFQDGQYLVACEAGATYRPVMDIVRGDSNLTMTMTAWNPGTSDGTRAAWTSEMTDDSKTVTYTLPGLSSCTGYRVYQDGELVYQQDKGFETISFTATGGGTFQVVTWEAPLYTPMGASFTYSSIGANYYFADRSYGPIVSWLWNFGDGTGSSTQSPTHKYKDTGSYRVTLTVYDAQGRSSVASTVVEVSLDETNPIDETEDGWDIWFSDELTVQVYPIGLLAGGLILMALARFGPEWPIVTRRGRAVIGSLMVAVAAYWFLFSDHAIISL